MLSSEETSNNFIDIRVTGFCSNLLECMFNVFVPIHFLLHFLFHELTPKTLNHERLLEIDLLLVFIVTCGQFSNLLLASDSFFLIVQSKLLVLDGCVETKHSNISFAMIQPNLVKNLFQLSLCLNSLLFYFSQFFSFLAMNIYFRFKGFFHFG